MPKLSKTRIINLNYNDGKRTIYNEIFDYGDGKDTLFSMDNGIGKTVLIQFFIQPFVRNKRELQGRKFEDYFSSTPTYIMHEVLLDNGEKLLVGMLIKKDSSEDEKNRLRILAFLNKYSKANDFDIINAPFVENKKILSFSECEDKIKKYKSGKLNFKYFNFNDSSKKSEYFDDLRAYRIDYKEWEDIIRNINNDESGLSNLYDKHKNDEALIRNVIIPLIESKINGEKNAIESIRNNLSKYIESYKQSKESINEVELYKAFQGDMGAVTQLLKVGIVKDDAREVLYKRLADIAILSEEELTKRSTEKLRHEELMEDLKNELARVAYEEHSLKYYNYLAQEEKIAQELLEVKSDYDNKIFNKQELVEEKYIQECAEIYEDILSIDSSLTEIRERIANYEREDTEVAQNIRNYKFTLKNLYGQELNELQEKEKNLINSQAKFQSELKKNEQEFTTNKLQQKENIIAAEAANNRINNFGKVEADFQKKYANFKAIRNVLLNEYDGKELESYRLGIDERINNNLNLQGNLQKEVVSLIAEKVTLGQRIRITNENLNQKNLDLEKKKNDLNLFNNETNKILQILTVKNLPLDPFSQKDKLQEIIKSDKNRLWQALVKEQDKLREIEDKVHRYKTGLIQIPKEVLQSFENKGIQFEYCLNWLQSYKGSKEEKENLIKNNPFFPYGILISTKDINVLKNESLDVYTSIPIPIINRNDLTKGLELDKNNDVLTIHNQEFLLSFNYLLIDEEERAELLRCLSLEIEQLKAEISNIQNSLDWNKVYEKTLADYPYQGDEDGIIKTEINNLEQNIDKLGVLLEQFNNEFQNNDNRKDAITEELHVLQMNQIIIEEEREKFNEFILEHQEFKKNIKELYSLQRLRKELEDVERKLEGNNSRIRDSLRDVERALDRIQNSIEGCSAKLELYQTVETGTFIEEDKNSIEARLQGCENELDGNMRRDKDDEKSKSESLRKEQNKLNRKAKEGNISDEYLGVSFSLYRLEDLKNILDALEKQIKDLADHIHGLEIDLNIILTKRQRELEDIQKLGFNDPISKEEIKDSRFETRRKKVEGDLSENKAIIEDYLKQIDILKLFKLKLEPYKSYTTNTIVDFNFKDLTAASNAIDKDLKSYEIIKKEISNIEDNLSTEIRDIYERYREKDRFIHDRLNSYYSKVRKISSHSDIESLLEIVSRKISTLELELRSIKLEEEVVIDEILRYTNHVLQELKTIDKKSNIKHLGKTQKLLEINIPEEKDEESLKEFINEKANYYACFEGDYSNHLDSDIQSAELLSKLIGNINRIRVDIKKIEKTGLVRKSWKEALSQNSGGEKFVSMFILLSSLMSYMRKRETDIDNKEEKKVLIMDNPFAKTNAEHLLEPMFQIAEKYNIQLLCFSGIGGSAVYNRFSKIYVAKVIQDRFRNKENVSFKAGNEETLELSDFTITREQVSMF